MSLGMINIARIEVSVMRALSDTSRVDLLQASLANAAEYCGIQQAQSREQAGAVTHPFVLDGIMRREEIRCGVLKQPEIIWIIATARLQSLPSSFG